MKKKGIFRRNWDIVLGLTLPVVGLLMTYIGMSNCGGDWGCLGWLMPFLISIQISELLMIIAVFRTVFNKRLNRKRWIFITLFMVIFVFILLKYGANGVQMFNPFIWFQGFSA